MAIIPFPLRAACLSLAMGAELPHPGQAVRVVGTRLAGTLRQDLETGQDLRGSIIESIVRRARPVVLTGLAAILVFIPFTSSVFRGPWASR